MSVAWSLEKELKTPLCCCNVVGTISTNQPCPNLAVSESLRHDIKLTLGVIM